MPANKISIAVQKAQDVLEVHNRWYAKFAAGTSERDDYDRVTSTFNQLLLFLLDHFDPNTTNRQEVGTLFVEEIKRELLSEEALSLLPDGLVPVAVVRELLFRHKLRLNQYRLTAGWYKLCQAYQNLLLS